MAKYVIEIPDDQINDYIAPSNDMIFRIPVYKRNGTFSHFVQSDLSLTPYTESDEQSVEKNAVNLCTSCKLFKEHFPECGDVNILFGDGVGNDNICCCNKYEPYTEPDRNAIENEVWDFVSRLIWSFVDREILGMDIALAVRDMTYQEAKAKYKAWLKQKDEIRVGDEVTICGQKRVVTSIDEKDTMAIDSDGNTYGFRSIGFRDEATKTGKHFPEVAELLKKMREE